MSNSVYDRVIATMLRSLRNLDAIVSKAEAHVAADKNLEEETLIRARLYPNMRPFIFQDRPGYTLKMTDEHVLRIRVRFDYDTRTEWKLCLDDL